MSSTLRDNSQLRRFVTLGIGVPRWQRQVPPVLTTSQHNMCQRSVSVFPIEYFVFHRFDFHIFQTYTCDVFFAQSWKDNRLRLPDNMTSEYRLLPIEWLTEIWRPDSFFKNAKSVNFQTMTIPNHYIWLWKDKTILYMVK